MRRVLLPLAAVIVLFALVPRRVVANGASLPDTVDVSLEPGSPTAIGVEATFGYLDAADGRHFDWICHEVLGVAAGPPPYFFRGGSGSYLATVRNVGISKDPD